MKYGFFVCFLFCSFWGIAQDFKPVKDPVLFRKQFAESSDQIKSVKSDFVQEKNMSMLSEKITSKGKFYFKKEKMVRLEYTQPYNYLMIINGDNILIKDDKKTSKVSASSNKMFKQINEIIVDCLQGTAIGKKDYDITPFENSTQFMLELVPKSKGLKEFFKKIRIYVDKKDGSVSSLEMNEVSGDTTLMRFLKKELNANIGNEVFAAH